MPPTHWTYDEVRPADDLSQGDFLRPTTELREILNRVHPHFRNEKYVGFVIATQTCDLARRGGAECPARYISIAAVRTLYPVLPRLVSSIEGAVVKDNVFRMSRKSRATELLERLVDQNEQALGLFYFHEDSELGIGDPSVAYLRVTVALKADHYPVLVSARRGRLKPEFQAKFGWLVGNLYARPATTDWAEQSQGDTASREVIDRLLKSRSIQWVEDKSLELLAAERTDYKDLPAADLVNEARRRKPPRLIDQVVDVVAEIAGRRVVTMLETRLKTFEHHVEKLTRQAGDSADAPAPRPDSESAIVTREAVDGEAPPPKPESAPALAFSMQGLRNQIVARAREHVCVQLTEKEATQLKTELKSEARLKQLLGK